MLADTPDVDGPVRKPRFQPGERSDEAVLEGGSVGFPVARMGLEHEFFLVDRSGEPRDLADLFLRACREAARERRGRRAWIRAVSEPNQLWGWSR